MPGADALTLRLPAEPATPSLVRRRVRGWLEVHQWPDDAVDDVVLAVHEAVANVVDHAYAPGVDGQVVLTATLVPDGRERRVRIVVQDSGRWRSPPADPGYRGRGLQMVRSCMDVVDIRRGTDSRGGTDLVMLTPAVAAAPGRRVLAAGVRRSDPGLLGRVRRMRARARFVAGLAVRLLAAARRLRARRRRGSPPPAPQSSQHPAGLQAR
ncbi:ATP-binding protein [Pseudonocardia xinjiangensis]|uniref:ATP-binding protein n=1 Tax=Pseudonocardia xinjiangensis TaxID=75289 RepID=UPI003D9347AC